MKIRSLKKYAYILSVISKCNNNIPLPTAGGFQSCSIKTDLSSEITNICPEYILIDVYLYHLDSIPKGFRQNGLSKGVEKRKQQIYMRISSAQNEIELSMTWRKSDRHIVARGAIKEWSSIRQRKHMFDVHYFKKLRIQFESTSNCFFSKGHDF